MRERQSMIQNSVRRLAFAAALCMASVFALPTTADSLQREGFPLIDGVTLIGVEGGKIKYRAAAGDLKADLKEIATLSIDSVPQFATGLTEFKAGKMRSAQRAFEDVWSGARADWIKHYAGFYLVQIYDSRNQPVDAASIYSKIAAANADLFFLSKPPVASLAEADENEKQRIGEQIMAVVADAKGEHRRLLRAYHKRVVGEDGDLPEIDGPRAADNPVDKLKAESKLLLPEGVWKMFARKKEPEGKWDSIKLLSQGDAKGTLEAIESWLSNPGDLPEKLFIKAKAQLQLAEAEKDQAGYRDAALTFMRIVIHFNRAGQTHPLVAPAQLEVAYIHKLIEREDIYNRILFGGDAGGGVHLVIDDAKEYPQYRKRYYQIIGEEPPAEEQP